jgi:HPt (histidine-containing phosphotransfer) domain-containing protein
MPQIIVLTADVSERSRARIAQAGITTIVGKPVLLDALRAALTGRTDRTMGANTVSDALIDERFLTSQQTLLGPARLRGLLRLFEETSAALLADMKAAAHKNDQAAVARGAHRLGSAASALALARLFYRCTALERSIASMHPEALVTAVSGLATLRNESLAELDERLRASEVSAAIV